MKALPQPKKGQNEWANSEVIRRPMTQEERDRMNEIEPYEKPLVINLKKKEK